MTSMKARLVPLSEAEVRAKEWEDSFRRAEELLKEAQETLRRQLERSAVIVLKIAQHVNHFLTSPQVIGLGHNALGFSTFERLRLPCICSSEVYS